MNGDHDQTPPTGWQFNPENATTPVSPQGAESGGPALPAPVPPAVEPPRETAGPVAADRPSAIPPLPVAAPAAPSGLPASPGPQSPGVPAAPQSPPAPNGPLQWSAADASAQMHAGSPMTFVGGAVVAAVLVFLLTRSIFSSVAIVVIALLYGFYARRQPRALQYRLDAGGIFIGQKHYDYSQFRSFSVMREAALPSVVLMPLKRFMPLTTVSLTPELAERVIAALAERLPMEAYRQDAMDTIIGKFHF